MYTIGRDLVFSLRRWSSRIPAELLGSSAVLRNLTQVFSEFRLQDFHLLWLTFPCHSTILKNFLPGERAGSLLPDPATPHNERTCAIAIIRFGLFPFRSPLLRESSFLSFPQGTEMVHFPWFAFALRQISTLSGRWVTPFGNPRLTGCLRLPGAFRSLPRPSSPCLAKAFTVCP